MSILILQIFLCLGGSTEYVLWARIHFNDLIVKFNSFRGDIKSMVMREDPLVSLLKVTTWTAIIQQRISCSTYKPCMRKPWIETSEGGHIRANKGEQSGVGGIQRCSCRCGLVLTVVIAEKDQNAAHSGQTTSTETAIRPG